MYADREKYNERKNGMKTGPNGISSSTSKIKKRLARKAELARASRRRKKAYVQDLEFKVDRLNAKIKELQNKDPSRSQQNSVALALSVMTELDKQPSSLIPNSKPLESEVREDSGYKSAEGQAQTRQRDYCVKANYKGDIRRFSFAHTNFSFKELETMLQRIYTLEAQSFKVIYNDEDNDVVSITSTAELFEAYRLSARHPTRHHSLGSVSSVASVKTASPRHDAFSSNPPVLKISVVEEGNDFRNRRRHSIGNPLEASLDNGNKRRKMSFGADASRRTSTGSSELEGLSFMHLQEVKIGQPSSCANKIWLPVQPTDTLGHVLQKYRKVTRSAPVKNKHISHCARLLDLKETTAGNGLEDGARLNIVQVETTELVPQSKDSFNILVNCEDYGFWIRAQVSHALQVEQLLQSVLSCLGHDKSVSLLYQGMRIPKRPEDTLGTFEMKEGDRIDVIDETRDVQLVPRPARGWQSTERMKTEAKGREER